MQVTVFVGVFHFDARNDRKHGLRVVSGVKFRDLDAGRRIEDHELDVVLLDHRVRGGTDGDGDQISVTSDDGDVLLEPSFLRSTSWGRLNPRA